MKLVPGCVQACAAVPTYTGDGYGAYNNSTDLFSKIHTPLGYSFTGKPNTAAQYSCDGLEGRTNSAWRDTNNGFIDQWEGNKILDFL